MKLLLIFFLCTTCLSSYEKETIKEEKECCDARSYCTASSDDIVPFNLFISLN